MDLATSAPPTPNRRLQQACKSHGVNLESRFGEDSATGAYNPSYNAGYGSNIGTQQSYGSNIGTQQSYGSSVPATQIQQTISSFDASGHQKVTTLHGTTDHNGVLNVKKTEFQYPSN
ncbi:uncharacterized protein LOC117580217 isoform X3 [Drosophila guanche]|uniref:uncharacterized protein LOC117580217 isoform X3 n=1 Tax=Drosophila guanche TaxID=7266 RepID=UPI001471456C|nr:uncharacterized protein LOC117580217 isoform X3 [Drosophila guanche]